MNKHEWVLKYMSVMSQHMHVTLDDAIAAYEKVAQSERPGDPEKCAEQDAQDKLNEFASASFPAEHSRTMPASLTFRVLHPGEVVTEDMVGQKVAIEASYPKCREHPI